MTRRTFLALALILLALMTGTSRAVQTPPKPAPASVSIPFELVLRHIVLKVKIDDSRVLSFVLDTGDKVAIIDIDRAKELGLKMKGEIHVGGAGSQVLKGSFVEGSNWTLPGLDNFSQPVALAIPLGHLAARFGHDFDGILGSDFIKQFVVEVDYQASVVKFYDKATFNYIGPGERFPIELNHLGHPYIQAEVTPVGGDPIKGKFVLDIGSGGALALYSPFVSSHHLPGSSVKTIKAIGVGGAGGQTSGQIGRVADLRIGKFKINGPITLFSEDKSGAFATSEIDGNIGQQIASKFKLFLDYEKEQIILEPNSTLADPFDRAYGGLALKSEDKDYKTFRITDVLENSPASEAGLQPDDVIIRIDDKTTADLTLSKVSDMFERPVSYKLTIKRGDQTRQVTLTPRKMV